MAAPALNVFIVSCGTDEMTARCVQSVLDASAVKVDIAVWDNAAPPFRPGTPSLSLSLARDPDGGARAVDGVPCVMGGGVAVYTSRDNEGFLGPNNWLYRHHPQRAPFVCLLNSDTLVKPGWDLALLGALEIRPDLGASGMSGAVLDEQCNCVGVATATEICDYLEGWCLCLRRKTIDDELSGTLFDGEHLSFAFCEDTDLSLRLKHKGYGLFALANGPEAQGRWVVHLRHQTTQKLVRDEAQQQKLAQAFAANHEYLKKRWAHYLANERVLLKHAQPAQASPA